MCENHNKQLLTITRVKKVQNMETSTVVLILVFLLSSAVAQRHCPTADSIKPCTCTQSGGLPSMHCIEVTDQDQLEQIFSAEFPDTNMVELKLEQSFLDQISRNVFANITFESINIDSYYLQSISSDAFENSKNTLQTIYIHKCKVSQDTFPFSSLETYTELISFEFQRNQIRTFPEISSESLTNYAITQNELGRISKETFESIHNLTNLYLTECEIDSIEAGAFESSEEIVTLSMEQNTISTLPPSIFHDLPNLVSLLMGHNQLTALERDIFNSGSTNLEFIGFNNNNLTIILTDTFQSLSHPYTYILLNDNMISTVEDNAFGTISNSTINLMNNQLTEIKESWMKPLLQSFCYINIDGNPFTCGCEISWLFEEPNYQFQVLGQCQDGSSIADLDPDYFQNNCLN